jgi:hypothetical protein
LLREWSRGLVGYDVRVEVSQQLFAGYDLVLQRRPLPGHLLSRAGHEPEGDPLDRFRTGRS